jgi:SNF2 family DNA or RNA helicase
MECQVRFVDNRYCVVASQGSTWQYDIPPHATPLPKDLFDFYTWLQRCNLVIEPYRHAIPGLAFPLMEHQQEALGYVLSRTRCILAMDMGLGKTATLLATLLVQQPKRGVILSPTGLLDNLESEIKKFVPGLQYHRIRCGSELDGFTHNALTLMPISLLDKLHPLIPKDCDFLAVDEAHQFKNITTKTSKCMFKVSKRLAPTARLVLLTGTPAQQHNHLYGLLRLLHPFFHSWFHNSPHPSGSDPRFFNFADRYCGPHRVFGTANHAFSFDNDTRRDELQAIIRPFFFRLLKSQVLNLPEPIQERVFVGALTKAQREEFDQKFERFQYLMENKSRERACAIFSELVMQTLQLKIPCVVQYLGDFLQKDPTRKFICFVSHQDMGDALCALFEERHVLHVRVDGQVPRDKRLALLEKVRTTHQVAVVSFGTCALGFNLNFVNTCFFCERIWEGVKQVQSESRIHRIGQQGPVYLYRLDLDGSMDVLMERKVNRKLRTEAFLLRDKEFVSTKKTKIECCDTQP